MTTESDASVLGSERDARNERTRRTDRETKREKVSERASERANERPRKRDRERERERIIRCTEMTQCSTESNERERENPARTVREEGWQTFLRKRDTRVSFLDIGRRGIRDVSARTMKEEGDVHRAREKYRYIPRDWRVEKSVGRSERDETAVDAVATRETSSSSSLLSLSSSSGSRYSYERENRWRSRGGRENVAIKSCKSEQDDERKRYIGRKERPRWCGNRSPVKLRGWSRGALAVVRTVGRVKEEGGRARG
ncbi:uncharacterized protein LOC143154828 [Ptiloglossa arizonensis]|uniref:uncharacterized protein LOC143154828 n=1 Tax=Ptiloglossa arizonensis TaxID=3350558 RepID=UPI003F9EEC7E